MCRSSCLLNSCICTGEEFRGASGRKGAVQVCSAIVIAFVNPVAWKAIFMDTVIEIIIEIIAEITELIVGVFKSKYRKKRPGKEKKMMHGENHE